MNNDDVIDKLRFHSLMDGGDHFAWLALKTVRQLNSHLQERHYKINSEEDSVSQFRHGFICLFLIDYTYVIYCYC